MTSKVEWTGKQTIDHERDDARVERVIVDGKPMRVVVSAEAIEDGISEGQIRTIAEARLALYGDTLPPEVMVTTADMRPA